MQNLVMTTLDPRFPSENYIRSPGAQALFRRRASKFACFSWTRGVVRIEYSTRRTCRVYDAYFPVSGTRGATGAGRHAHARDRQARMPASGS